MKHFVVTIGREFGSRGREIGSKLAGDLGVKFYDKELINLAAKRSGFCEGVLRDVDEYINNSLTAAFSGSMNRELSNKLFAVQRDIILEKAAAESCVIIGRCADYILKDMEHCMHVFIFAPYQVRFNRIFSKYDMTDAAIDDMIEQMDCMRHNYYKYYTKSDRGERHNKHILLDSSFLGVDGTVALLKDMINRKFGE